MGMPPRRTNTMHPAPHHLQLCGNTDDTPIGLHGIHAGLDMKIIREVVGNDIFDGLGRDGNAT